MRKLRKALGDPRLRDWRNLTQLVSSQEWDAGRDTYTVGLPAPAPSSICHVSQEGSRNQAGSSPGGPLQLGRTEQDAAPGGSIPHSALLGRERREGGPDLPTG